MLLVGSKGSLPRASVFLHQCDFFLCTICMAMYNNVNTSHDKEKRTLISSDVLDINEPAIKHRKGDTPVSYRFNKKTLPPDYSIQAFEDCKNVCYPTKH
jgi:hypothetical protein